ncbi:MAG: aldose epimerase family protein [Eubacteriales bacterium]
MKITEKNLNADVNAFVLENSKGFSVEIWTLGAIIQSIKLPSGEDVVLGYDSPEAYQKESCFFGTAVGPYANRISGAMFSLNGKTYHLEDNDGGNNLHSGSTGLHTKIFTAELVENALVLSTSLPHLEGGFPGELSVKITYALSEENSLSILYTATSTEDTIVNLTNHSYFNLDGHDSLCLKNKLQIFADEFTFNNENNVPTGDILALNGTPLDFREMKEIGRDIGAEDINLINAGGYDHNYIINEEKVLKEFAVAEGSLAVMRAFTTCPCVQLYTGNFIGTHQGKEGVTYKKHSGFCLETGVYPNAINEPNFPSAVLLAGDTWQHETVFQFQIK